MHSFWGLGLVPPSCGFVHHELVNLFLHRQSGIRIFKSHLDLLRTFAMDSTVIFYCNSGYRIAADVAVNHAFRARDDDCDSSREWG